MAQSHEYLSIEYSEEEVWLTWTDRNNEHHEKSVRQLAQEARAGNAHDENVLSYYRYQPRAEDPSRVPVCQGHSAYALHKAFLHTRTEGGLRPRLSIGMPLQSLDSLLGFHLSNFVI